MASLEVKVRQKNQQTLFARDEEDFEDNQLQQQLLASRQVAEELAGSKHESLSAFEQLVTKIYKGKVKCKDLSVQIQGIEISIQTNQIEDIIHKVLLETCQIHKSLIGQQMRSILQVQSAEYYFKIDSIEETGFFDAVENQWENGQTTELQQIQGKSELKFLQHRLAVNKQFYSYCVWVIYHHFCSLHQCNKQIIQLSRRVGETSDHLFFRLLQKLQDKTNSNQQQFSLIEGKNSRKLNFINKHMASLEKLKRDTLKVKEYQIVKISQLNIEAIINLIPPAMPKMENGGSQSQKLQQNVNDLYGHICKFQTIITEIIQYSSQNMRKFILFLKQFKKAIRIIKRNFEKDLEMRLNGIVPIQQLTSQNFTNKSFFRMFQQQKQIQSEIQKRIDKQIHKGQFNFDDEKSRFNEDEFLKNVNASQPLKQKFIMKQKSYQSSIREFIFSQQYNKIKKFEQSSQIIMNKKKISISKKKLDFNFKNSTIFEKHEQIQSITKLEAKLTDDRKQRIKLEVIVKNEKKITKCGEDFFYEQLKHNFNLINNEINKQEQFNSYSEFLNKRQKALMKMKNKLSSEQLEIDELALRKFKSCKQRNQSQQDQLCDQKLEKKESQNEKKKKKKKNKKKKQVKEQVSIPQMPNQTESTNQQAISYQNVPNKKEILKNQCTQQQIQIIKSLEGLKFDKQMRSNCFLIDLQKIRTMYSKQIVLFNQSIGKSTKEEKKVKEKTKKSKIKS